ncbi:MFS transporter [Companilactobacillus baiquanensis]|uniref:MFS transporter n=1 Tax=Companilactobacillus baiquanensis TaxID=2486005 RepID=A0ABW1UTE1_9LACO|nr:MFS transporter [Companilactobacillus baiquanensis]
MDQRVSTRVKLSILAVGLLSFVGILVETSMNVTFPTLTKDLNVSLGTVQWLTTGYLLLTTIVMSTTAYILKKFKPIKIFSFAALSCFVGTLICMFSPNFVVLLCGRLIQAIATGLATPLMFNLIFEEVPPARIGVYTGFASIIISLAPALGPTYGGIVSGMWSWRAIFIGVIPIIVLLSIIGFLSIKGESIGTQTSFDYLSVAGLAAIFTMILFTFDQAGRHGFISMQFGIWILMTIAVVAIFGWYNAKSKRQLIDFSILKIPVLRFRLFGYFGLQFINIGLSFVLPIFAQTVLKMNSAQAGLMLLPGSLIGAMVGPVAGYIYDKKGPTIPLVLSGFLVTIGAFLFFVVGKDLTLVSIILIYLVLRVGFNFGFGPSLSDGSMQVTGRSKSDQNSLFSMMQQYAGSLGTNVLSVIISVAALNHGEVASTIIGSKLDFGILTVISLMILISVIYVERKYKVK